MQKPEKKLVQFVADTGGKTVTVGLDVRVRHGENTWGKVTAEKYLTEELKKTYKVVVIGGDVDAPVVEPQKVEFDNGPVEESFKKVLKDNKAVDNSALLSPARFTKLEKKKAQKVVDETENVQKLKQLRAELEGYMGSNAFKTMLDTRIAELTEPTVDTVGSSTEPAAPAVAEPAVEAPAPVEETPITQEG